MLLKVRGGVDGLEDRSRRSCLWGAIQTDNTFFFLLLIFHLMGRAKMDGLVRDPALTSLGLRDNGLMAPQTAAQR